MVQFILKLLLKQISCCVPPFPLIALLQNWCCYKIDDSWTSFMLCYVEELEILERSELDILPPTQQPWLPLWPFKRGATCGRGAFW